MNIKKLHSIVWVISLLILTACGTDTKPNPDNSEGPYTFFNATTPLKITQQLDANGTAIGSQFSISVQLLEYGFGKAAENIEMKPFDFKYGFLTNSVVITDLNGIATFTYNLPENYSSIRGQDITIQAVYFDPTQVIINIPNKNPTKKSVLLMQDFVLEFR